MGEISEMMLDGTLCMYCGAYDCTVDHDNEDIEEDDLYMAFSHLIRAEGFIDCLCNSDPRVMRWKIIINDLILEIEECLNLEGDTK